MEISNVADPNDYIPIFPLPITGNSFTPQQPQDSSS
ncbi:hypothetical protein AVDCRST_MAG94-2120 [uncultured Leptolyngbya sp.]|uniref:Uncharacterized protein n=1 Tax=uncultured Leptolyngbya sp. TaxID=332963 RepID=A0A6J4LL40_9CYAN|nr:hypothetical protein AVDCRST_MAG94-2120 [uncultured Leptolyngbya sp.]